MGEWIEIELVEEPTKQRRVAVEPTEPKAPPKPPRLGGRDRRLVGIGVGVVAVVVITWAVAQSGRDVSTATPPVTLDESGGSVPVELTVEATQPRPSTTRPRGTSTTTSITTGTSRPPLVVQGLGGPLLPTPSGIRLVGLTSAGDLLDIDLDAGEMTNTDLPGSSAGAPASIVAGESWTHVQHWDVNASFLVLLGQEPVDTASTISMRNGLFRGPDPETMWVTESDPFTGSIDGLSLIGLDGEPLGRSIDLRGWWPMQSDLTGGVVVQAGGGVYVVSEAGARRVADGELVGTGVNHFLVRACDEALACGLFIVDRASGERRQVPVIQVDGQAQYYGWVGTDSASVSPDGTAAILFGLDGDGQAASLLGTDTGVYRTLSRVSNTFSVAWSDDSRYVVYSDGRVLQVHDRQTGDDITFPDLVPRLINFVSRP